MQKARWFLLLLIAGTAVSMQSCLAKKSNEAEKRIEGKWQQDGGSGLVADTNVQYEYTFESGHQFLMVARVVNQPLRAIGGTYKIVNDSLLLYYRDNPDTPYFSAKVTFNSFTKLALTDINGELDFIRK